MADHEPVRAPEAFVLKQLYADKGECDVAGPAWVWIERGPDLYFPIGFSSLRRHRPLWLTGQTTFAPPDTRAGGNTPLFGPTGGPLEPWSIAIATFPMTPPRRHLLLVPRRRRRRH